MKNFYLLYGEDKSIIKKEIDNIISKLSLSLNDVVNYNIENVKDIIEDASTISMFSKNKLLIINITSYLSEGKSIDNINLLEDYIENYNKDSYLIFVSYSDNIDSRKKIVKLISKLGITLKKEVTDDYLEKYIINYLNESNIKISNINIKYLIARCGSNIDNLSNELDKLILYKKENEEITKEDIETLTFENLDDSVYDLVNSFLKKDINKAIKLYKNFLLDGMDSSQIVAIISSQIRLLFQVKRLHNQNKTNEEIAKILEFKSVYRVKYLLADSYYYNEKDLLNYLKELSDIDKKIKVDNIDGNTLVELFLSKKDM